MSLLLILASASSIVCAAPIVHDGDTIRCGNERIRIVNIDAPEMPGSPKCQDRRRSYAWCDFRLAYRSRDALRAYLARGQVIINRQGVDRFGRTLASISVNGRDAGDYLVSLNLARPWR
jgi:micrococcal nuclease